MLVALFCYTYVGYAEKGTSMQISLLLGEN